MQIKELTDEAILEIAEANLEQISDELTRMFMNWRDQQVNNKNIRQSFPEFLEDHLQFDSFTGLPMTEGWVIGEYRISSYDGVRDEERAEALCQQLWGQTLEEAYAESEELGADAVYWTTWEG